MRDFTINTKHIPTAYVRGGGYYRGHQPYPVSGRGGYRVGKPPVHRHRTLVLNNSATSPSAAPTESGSASDSSSPSWVTRNDRHLQLINSNIYQEQTEARTKAIEQTRLHKMQRKENNERVQFMNHVMRTGNPRVVSANSASVPAYEVIVDGIKFAVAKNGSKLVKLPGASSITQATCILTHARPGDSNAPKATPKVAVVGGVRFHRTKNGNMYRQAVVKAQRYVAHSDDTHLLTRSAYRRSGGVNKVNVPCRNFSTTGNPIPHSSNTLPSCSLVIRRRLDRGLRTRHTDHPACQLGSCPKGPMCRYTHNHAKVAACKDFLQKGHCVYGDSCDLSHDLTPERTPHCVHFERGNCSKSDCSYTHRVLPPGVPVCRDFGFYGYCDKGISCPDRHSFECPDFSNTGICKNKGCKLPHRERASVLRKASAAAREQAEGEGDGDKDDLSSDDDDDSVASDEVDSDEVDEFVGDDGSVEWEQQDFISL